MVYRSLIRALALGVTIVLAGCATGPDCRPAVETAEASALERLPPGEWIDAVDNVCTDAAMAKWNDVLARACAPVYGLHTALSGGEKPADCSGAAFDSAWSLGEMIGEMRGEADEIERRLEDETLPPETRRNLQRRLVVIARDLPQVEALARMDGYLPPAEIPDAEQPVPE